MIDLNTTILIITFNVNDLNNLFKRQRFSDCINKSKNQVYSGYTKFTLNIKILIC